MRSTLFCALAIGLLMAGCSRDAAESVKPIASTPKQPSRLARPNHFQTHWQDESQFIVESIATDLAEMALFAADGSAAALTDVNADAYELAPTVSPTYEVVISLGKNRGSITCLLAFEQPIWAPESYRPVTRALFEQLKLSPSGTEAVETSALLNALLSPKSETLAAIDLQLSKELVSQFNSAAKHDEAALLLASFALREATGLFYEGRSELCRTTAHLAFADALRDGGLPTVAGSIAKAAHTVGYNNQVAALDQLQQIADSEETKAWKRALRMRATNDFRIRGETDRPTLLEIREWFRARAESVNVDRAWHSLRLTDEDRSMADWARIARSHETSIGLGHVMLETALAGDLEELTAIVRMEMASDVTQMNIVELLNREPNRCVFAGAGLALEVRVLGLGRWAAFEQRAICSAIAADFHFMHKRWSVPDRATTYREEMDAAFFGLRLYPLVRRQNSTDDAYYRKGQDDAMALVRRAPQVVPSEAWNEICYNVPFGRLYIPPPHAFINEWHKQNPPAGAAYHPFPRMNHPSLVNQPDAIARLEQMHLLAPHDTIITYNLLRIRDGEEPPADKIEEAYGPVIDYDPSPSRKMAKHYAKDPVKFEQWISKAAALDPSDLEELADWYVTMKREDVAAATYAQWIANEINELRVARSAEWLVIYLERKGQIESAASLAERAADTGSAAGFMTKARHLARMGKIDDALDVYLENQERYNAPEPLIAFVLKLPPERRTPRCEQELKASTQDIFPDGFQKVAVSGKAAAPKRGVRVHGENDRIRGAGLQLDDIVVAVRGYQVPNWRGFKVLRALDEDTPYTMSVWRKDRYLNLKALPADYRFGLNLENYQEPEAKGPITEAGRKK